MSTQIELQKSQEIKLLHLKRYITFFLALGTSQLAFVMVSKAIVSTQWFKFIGTRTTHFAVY
jgi:hypothetical protein